MTGFREYGCYMYTVYTNQIHLSTHRQSQICGINFNGRPGTWSGINWAGSVNVPLIVNILDINLDERDTT